MAAHSMLNMSFPVLLPETPELRFSKDDFDRFIKETTRRDATETLSTTTAALSVKAKPDIMPPEAKNRFMEALLDEAAPTLDDRDGKMFTENGDVTFRTSNSALVDLFSELEEVVGDDRIKELLDKAWAEDSLATLKLIWNARSIHLGKSSRMAFYRAVGWLYETHPATLLYNLPFLVRPIIQKKAENASSEKRSAEVAEMSDDFELIEGDEANGRGSKRARLDVEDDESLARWDVKNGVSHAYWKDLLNILALAVNGQLKVDGNPREVLNVRTGMKRSNLDYTEGRKKLQRVERFKRVVKELKTNSMYKALHLSVARLFADQLRLDSARLRSGDRSEIKRISLAAKWAPSGKGMHDQHTAIVSTIAELLYSREDVASTLDPSDRQGYLLLAREAYQRLTLSPLRKYLQIVERPISANEFEAIKYERIPSLAMKQYTPLFARKDFDRFDKYLDAVAEGKSHISGATLLPSTMVASVLHGNAPTKSKQNALLSKKLSEIQGRSAGSQWKTLCQRIADSGTLASSIAVADVSGSMSWPRFPDGTCPMDSAIGLSLLLAEVGTPPFGGAFITFHQRPQILRAGGKDDQRSFAEKVQAISRAEWGGNTNLVAVFDLVLSLAVEHELKPEEMVKRIFVFSDMHFDQAERGGDRWTTSFERIKAKFQDKGYELPELVFWNLAGGRDGGAAPKPIQADEPGCALVSGYSQGQLKMFLENGQFAEEEEEVIVKDDEDGTVVVTREKPKIDPMATVKKAISHDAYRMLKVVD